MSDAAKLTRFRVQAGALLFELEGDAAFIRQQLETHHDHIQAILAEQARLIRQGKVLVAGRRGRPSRGGAPRAGGRRPGRQPVIIRESSLQLKPRQLQSLARRLTELAAGGTLGKDATVFAIGYELCKHILKSDQFTAGDISAAYGQLGRHPSVPPATQVDVVQMLRNLAAASIGKQWVERRPDGTFTLTAKGKAVGASGAVIRPRGRRPGSTAARRGRPPKKRGPGRPKKS